LHPRQLLAQECISKEEREVELLQFIIGNINRQPKLRHYIITNQHIIIHSIMAQFCMQVKNKKIY
jgi:hypothetical protein